MSQSKLKPVFERCRDLEDRKDGPDMWSAVEASEKGKAPGVDAVAIGWPADPAYSTAELYFTDRDLFVEYVRSTLNPAREKEGLSTCTPAVASHLFDVITTRRYRQPSGEQANTKVRQAP